MFFTIGKLRIWKRLLYLLLDIIARQAHSPYLKIVNQ